MAAFGASAALVADFRTDRLPPARWRLAITGAAVDGRHLKQSDAEALLICSNTMHRLHEAIEQASGIPVSHIADAIGKALRRTGWSAP